MNAKRMIPIALSVAFGLTAGAGERPIRIACVGDSITQGFGIPAQRRKECAYPAVLGRLLGPGYEVLNLGACGRTLLRDEKMAWTKTDRPKRLERFKPDVFVLMLGTNDSKMRHWIHKDRFENDLETFVKDFRQINPKARILICLPPPAFDRKTNELSSGDSIAGIRIRDEILPILNRVAAREKLEVVDVFSAMLDRAELFADGVHPNEEGAKLLAETIRKAIRTK